MSLKHCLRCLIPLVGGVLPILVFWLLIVVVASRHHTVIFSHPVRFFDWPLGPVQTLVYLDPWYAPLSRLESPEAVLVVGLALVGLTLWGIGMRICRNGLILGPTCSNAGRVIALSTAVGLVLAAPWIHALIRLFTEPVP